MLPAIESHGSTRASRTRRYGCFALVVAALAALPASTRTQTPSASAPARNAAAAPAAARPDLGTLFAKGVLLQDENQDEVIDAIRVRFALPAQGAPHDVAAAANLAARLGFEASAFTPGLAALDRDLDPTTIDTPVIAVGRSNAHVQRLAGDPAVGLRDLQPGQGLVAFTSTPRGTPIVLIAGADDEGTEIAGAAAAARLPYLWQVRGESIATVQQDVRTFLESKGAQVARSAAVRAVYEKGKQRMVRLTLDVDVRTGADRAAAALEALAKAHVVGQAQFGAREADTLNYYGLDALEIRITSGRTVTIERFGPPYESNFPGNPWRATPKPLAFGSIFTIDGIFGDSRGNDRIPDESEARIVIGRDAGGAIGAVDLAARIGVEGAGVSLPIAFAESERTVLKDDGTAILVGGGALASSVAGAGSGAAIPAGEGELRIVDRALGAFPAILVTGGDLAGVNAAARYFARSVPYLWTPRKGETSFWDIEEQVRDFFRARTNAGQAAAALAAIDETLGTLTPQPRAFTAAIATEQADAALGAFVTTQIQQKSPSAGGKATADSRYGPVPILDETPDLGWEVDELRAKVKTEVLPKVKAGSRVTLDVLVSEGPELRTTLEREFAGAITAAGAADAKVRVISAYKQGFSWINDYVLPQLRGKAVGTITVKFPTAVPPAGGKTHYGMPIRWLQELFPIDAILARELKIDVDATRFEKVDGGPITYVLEATDKAGKPILRDEFSPRFVLREYFPQKPTATIDYTTGGATLTVDGTVAASFDVRTDPERFWDFYQQTVMPKMIAFVQKYARGRLVTAMQPYFRDLLFDITMSEPDFRLNLQEERISSLDSLHEDLMFVTIDWWSILSGNKPGSRDVAPGRIMPLIQKVVPGQAPKVHIRAFGNRVPEPTVALTWTKADGGTGEKTMALAPVERAAEKTPFPRPRVTAVRVQAGSETVRDVTVSVQASDLTAARAMADRVRRFAAAQAAGAYPAELNYQGLDRLTILVEHAAAKIAATIQPKDKTVLAARQPPPIVAPEPGKRIVPWDHVVGPQELEEQIIPRLRGYPEINAYVAGRSYRGRNVWAMDVMLPIKSEIWSQAKASTMKPVLFLSTRVHANEVSATSAGLHLMQLLATDPEYRRYLQKMNIVYRPIENVDGAANHQEFYKLQPTYILHAGYWSSVARDVTAYLWDDDPLLPEALVRRKIYYTWMPDVFMDPHGYPSHEWVHQFAGYKVPWFMAFWIPRGYHINLHHLDDPNYPDHKAVGTELRDRIIEEVMDGVPGFRNTNAALLHRFEKYARRYEPDPFRLEIYKGMNILFNHSYSYEKGGPFSREVYVNAIGRKPDPEAKSFLERHPNVTVLDLGCDMPDETSSAEWMETFASAGQLGYQRAVIKTLYESDWKVQRFEEDFTDTVRLSVFRPRPVKASRAASYAASGVSTGSR